MNNQVLYTPGNGGTKFRLRFFQEVQPYDTGGDLIRGVLQPATLAAIVGASGSRKTFLALHTAMCLARGQDWFGHAVQQIPAIYVAAESGESFSNRLVAYRMAHGLEDAVTPFADITDRPDILKMEDVAGLIETIKYAESRFEVPAGFIVFDTLAAVMPGGDENSGADMTRMIDGLLRIKAETGATVCLVHHLGKDAARGARGHSSFKAALDTLITVTAEDSRSIAHIEKQRDLEGGDDFAFELDPVQILIRGDGSILQSCVVREMDLPKGTQKAQRLNSRQRRALDVLQNIIADHGQPAPEAEHYPLGAMVVPVELWRESLFAADVLDRSGSNPRQDFKRLRDALADKGVMRAWNDLVWVV